MSGSLQETPQERLSRYRNLAEEARQAAARAGAADVGAGYAGLAKSWDDLADQLERELGLAPSSAMAPGGGTIGTSFGSTDQPPCEQCGQPALLSRRAPHPTRGPAFELQTFSCPGCGHTQTRDADWRGKL
jgi:hypothetical protein